MKKFDFAYVNVVFQEIDAKTNKFVTFPLKKEIHLRYSFFLILEIFKLNRNVKKRKHVFYDIEIKNYQNCNFLKIFVKHYLF